MHIAYVTTELQPGGAEKCVVRLAKQMAANGHAVLVVSLRPIQPSEGSQPSPLLDQLAESEISVVACDLQGWVGLLAARARLRQALEKFAPDLVHSFLFHAHMVVRSLQRKRRWAWLLSERVADPHWSRKFFSRIAYRTADAVCCVSQSVADSLPTFVQRRCPVVVIGNGVELSESSTEADAISAESALLAEHGIKEDATLLLAAGRLHRQKGLAKLIQSAAEMLVDQPNAILAIAGAGPEQGLLEELLAASPAREQIKLLGYRDDLPRWHQRADLFLLCSQWEGMPNVLLEAMAAQTAVVAFAVEGVREAVTHRPEAQIAAAGDWPSFIQLVRRRLCTPEALVELGEGNGVAMLSRRWPGILAEYEALYESVLHRVAVQD